MDLSLEVVVLPVSDVDAAVRFYVEDCGFALDHDIGGPGHRVVQVTPPGSACSVAFGDAQDMPRAEGDGVRPGLQLVVDDVEAARSELLDRGVDVGHVRHMRDGRWQDGHGGDWNAFAFFRDPDGNVWALQERPG